jgi:membrane protease YdiL (CAAX protease family)
MSEFENSPTRTGYLPASPVRWGIPAAAIGLGLAELAIIVDHFLARHPDIPHTDPVAVAFQAVFYALLAVYVVLVSRVRGLGTPRKDFGFDLRWVDLPLGAALAIVSQFAIGIAATVAVNILRLPPTSATNATLPDSRLWAVVSGIGIVSFLGPIVEKLLFRGLLLRAIRNLVIRVSRRESDSRIRRAGWISIVASAVIFAAGHLYEAQNTTELVELAISTLIFGLGAGWIATRTGRLGPSIIAHIVGNAIVVAGVLAAR